MHRPRDGTVDRTKLIKEGCSYHDLAPPCMHYVMFLSLFLLLVPSRMWVHGGQALYVPHCSIPSAQTNAWHIAGMYTFDEQMHV